jgi:SPOR domain
MLGQRHIEPEDDGFERPAPPAAERSDGSGGVLRWVVAAIAIGVFGASLWYAYQRGSRDAGADYRPPLIKADPSPTKLRPEEPGGMPVPNRDKLIYERLVADAPDKRVERLLPPPETPMPKPTAADETASPVSVGSSAVVPPKPVEERKPPSPRTETLTLKLDKETQQPLAPEQMEAATPATEVAPAPEASTVEAKAEPAPQAEAQSAPSTPRGYGLQLASLRDPDGAPNEWLRLQAAFGSILGKTKHRVLRVDLGDRGIFFRLVAVSFADKAAARAACDKLEALKQGCLVVELN